VHSGDHQWSFGAETDRIAFLGAWYSANEYLALEWPSKIEGRGRLSDDRGGGIGVFAIEGQAEADHLDGVMLAWICGVA
jgi:hypothetical protein